MRTTALLGTVMTLTVGAGGYALVRGSVGAPKSGYGPITRVDLEQPSIANVYDAVHELRHEWLVPDSVGSFGIRPTVYIEMGCCAITCLRFLESDLVEEIRYLDQHSTEQLGPRTEPGGAIVITLRTRSTVHSKGGSKPWCKWGGNHGS